MKGLLSLVVWFVIWEIVGQLQLSSIVPPFSAVTYARELSGRNADERGRAPTSIILITLLLAVSITATWLSSSDVT